MATKTTSVKWERRGKDGISYQYFHKLTASESAPDTPVSSPNDNYIPTGWSKVRTAVTRSLPYCWMIERRKEDTWSDFSTPLLVDRFIDNYMIPVWWDNTLSYKITEAGIPVVKVPDSTTLGYSAFSLIVHSSTAGQSPVGSNEWRLMESTEYMLMQNAYIEKLQATLVTAEKIESLVIKTGLLEVLEGAKIAGFDIGSGRIGTTQSPNAPATAGMSLYDSFIKFSGDGASVFLGTNVLPSTTGMVGMGRIEHANANIAKIGLYFDIAGADTSFWNGASNNVAIQINRGVIAGARFNGVNINLSSSGYTIGKESVICIYTTADHTVKLPSNPEPWDFRWIFGINNQNYTLHGNGKNIWSAYSGSVISLTFRSGMLVYTGEQWAMLV